MPIPRFHSGIASTLAVKALAHRRKPLSHPFTPKDEHNIMWWMRCHENISLLFGLLFDSTDRYNICKRLTPSSSASFSLSICFSTAVAIRFSSPDCKKFVTLIRASPQSWKSLPSLTLFPNKDGTAYYPALLVEDLARR